ncbi:uncharacterized protein [Engystomops pustulosus]|uniref:uncharacterized protein n=1 Tax=Engystomops pustulosus TaxID=76066 RepID=UPI003AFAA111
MSGETFSYDPETTANILAKVSVPSDFLRVANSEYKTRDYERVSRNLLNYQLHCATLTEYLKVQRIPRGLRVALRPTIFKDNKDFCNTFQQILNKCSFDLITLTVEYLQKEITKTEENISMIENQLTSTLTTEEIKTLKGKTTQQLERFRKESEKKKRDKFIRDTQDYLLERVYRWQDAYPTRAPYRGYRDTAESSSSGSDFYGPPSARGRFLGQRDHRRGRQRRGGEDNIGATQGPTMTTRSQVTHPR